MPDTDLDSSGGEWSGTLVCIADWGVGTSVWEDALRICDEAGAIKGTAVAWKSDGVCKAMR
jgi:hypothetical protein